MCALAGCAPECYACVRLLCDAGAAGSVRCDWGPGGCAGSADAHCYPLDVWSGVMVHTGVYWAVPHLSEGVAVLTGACGTLASSHILLCRRLCRGLVYSLRWLACTF